MDLSAVALKPRRDRLKAPPSVHNYNPFDDGEFTAIPDTYWNILRKPVPAEGCKKPKAPLDTALQRDLVLYIAHLLWRGKKRQKPTWTELLENAELSRMLDCSTRSLIETVDDLVARGVLAVQAEDGRRGYQYTLLVGNWGNVKPRPDPKPEGEEKANKQLPPVHCSTDASRIVVLPGKTRSITLGQSVRDSGKTEIRNELPIAQVETWEDSGVFRVRVSQYGEQLPPVHCVTDVTSPPDADTTTANRNGHRQTAAGNNRSAKSNDDPQKLELYSAWLSLREQCPKPINVTLDAECRKIFISLPLTTCERILEDTSIRLTDWNRPGKNLDFVPDGPKYLKSKIWDTDPVQRVKALSAKEQKLRQDDQDLIEWARRVDAKRGNGGSRV